ncbi:hypothetical protein ACHAO5_006153, partial [Verticillium nonalfalfae]
RKHQVAVLVRGLSDTTQSQLAVFLLAYKQQQLHDNASQDSKLKAEVPQMLCPYAESAIGVV